MTSQDLECWDADGPKEDPTIRLGTTIDVFGSPFHATAFRVRTIEGVQVLDNARGVKYSNDITQVILYFDELYEAFGDDGAYRTIVIGGKDYVVFLSPFCV